jgi:hypothetical protein
MIERTDPRKREIRRGCICRTCLRVWQPFVGMHKVTDRSEALGTRSCMALAHMLGPQYIYHFTAFQYALSIASTWTINIHSCNHMLNRNSAILPCPRTAIHVVGDTTG